MRFRDAATTCLAIGIIAGLGGCGGEPNTSAAAVDEVEPTP